MIVLYGISNCDTMRKSGKWLDQRGIPWSLHDYRKHGIDPALAEVLVKTFGAQQLVNKRGTTWRKLDATQQEHLTEPALTAALIMAHPALIKRPIAHTQAGDWLIGYDQLITLTS